MMLDILEAPTTDLDKLSEIQNQVAEKVVREDMVGEPDTVAGCDLSFSEEDEACAACVIFEYPELEKKKSNVVKVNVDFPYIPTFLAFRELEPMLKVIKEMESDLYMIDSQGLAHPRRAGLASHLGVVADRPTMGVAKNRLCGEGEEPGVEKGSYSYLEDDEETIGAIVRTRTDINPVYVSIGHKISLEKSIEIALKTSKYKVPEPIRAAHRLATETMEKS